MNIDMTAQAVGVTRRTLYNWMEQGLLSYTLHNGSRHLKLEDARALAACRHLPQAARDASGWFVKADRWTAEELAEVKASAAKRAKRFGIEPPAA